MRCMPLVDEGALLGNFAYLKNRVEHTQGIGVVYPPMTILLGAMSLT